MGHDGGGVLTAPDLSGKAPAIRRDRTKRPPPASTIPLYISELTRMTKPEWGAKRSCPKCATRFYDLTKADPITCINCGYAWSADPVLKSKQPMPYEQVKVAEPEKIEPDADADLDIDIDEDGDSPDNDVDLGGDDDLGVATTDGDEDEV
jgi:uncharacterized protein (TIGR02300 family)